jgi:hypothetical protein
MDELGKGVNHVSGTDLGFLACPARFERATWALAKFGAQGFNKYISLINCPSGIFF